MGELGLVLALLDSFCNIAIAIGICTLALKK